MTGRLGTSPPVMVRVGDISAGSPLARLALQDNANNWVRYVKMYPAVGQYINIKEMFVSSVASLHQGQRAIPLL